MLLVCRTWDDNILRCYEMMRKWTLWKATKDCKATPCCRCCWGADIQYQLCWRQSCCFLELKATCVKHSCPQPAERAYAAVSHNCSIFAHFTHTQPTHILYLITKVVNLNRIQGPFTDHEGVQLEQDSRPSDHKGVQSEQDSEPDSTWSSWIT